MIHVACLCAAWCRLCDGYRAVQEQVALELSDAGLPLQWHWIDIEDDAELLGEVDVETFPTIVVADDRQVRFAGPLTPQPETLRRVLRACITDAAPDARWPRAEPAVEDFVERLRSGA